MRAELPYNIDSLCKYDISMPKQLHTILWLLLICSVALIFYVQLHTKRRAACTKHHPIRFVNICKQLLIIVTTYPMPQLSPLSPISSAPSSTKRMVYQTNLNYSNSVLLTHQLVSISWWTFHMCWCIILPKINMQSVCIILEISHLIEKENFYI